MSLALINVKSAKQSCEMERERERERTKHKIYLACLLCSHQSTAGLANTLFWQPRCYAKYNLYFSGFRFPIPSSEFSKFYWDGTPGIKWYVSFCFTSTDKHNPSQCVPCKVHSNASSRQARSGTGMLLWPHLNISCCNYAYFSWEIHLFIEM